MSVMGEPSPSSVATLTRSLSPSEDTAYCCLLTSGSAPPAIRTGKRAPGVPGASDWMLVATEHENNESNSLQNRFQHEKKTVSSFNRRINSLPPQRVLANDRLTIVNNSMRIFRVLIVDPSNESHSLPKREKTKKLPVRDTAVTTPCSLLPTLGDAAERVPLWPFRSKGEEKIYEIPIPPDFGNVCAAAC